MRRTWLAVISLVLALGAPIGYALLIRVPLVRNHPGAYVAAFALAMAVAIVAVARGHGRRWPAWIALGVSAILLLAGGWFNYVVARVPAGVTVLRVGERPPDFTLPDAEGKPVSLADFRGRKPVVVVFYRGYW